MNFVQDICDDIYGLFMVIRWKVQSKNLKIKLFADRQGFWQADVWEADVGDARADIEPLTGIEGWKESSAVGSDAQCLCGEVVCMKYILFVLELVFSGPEGMWEQPKNSGL